MNTVQKTLVEAWGLIRETFVDPTFNNQGSWCYVFSLKVLFTHTYTCMQGSCCYVFSLKLLHTHTRTHNIYLRMLLLLMILLLVCHFKQIEANLLFPDWDLKLQQTMVEMFPLRSADAAYNKISTMLSSLGDPFTRIISPKVLTFFQIRSFLYQ